MGLFESLAPAPPGVLHVLHLLDVVRQLHPAQRLPRHRRRLVGTSSGDDGAGGEGKRDEGQGGWWQSEYLETIQSRIHEIQTTITGTRIMCLCNDGLDNQVDDERAKYGPIPVSDKALVGVMIILINHHPDQ